MKGCFFKACFALLCYLCSLDFLHAQCNTNTTAPVVSLTGDTCISSILTVQSNVLPNAIVWTLNGQPLQTNKATFASSAVTIAGSSSGSGGTGPNQLRNPDRIFVTEDGTVYVPDLGNNRIQKWLPGATAGITVAGGNGVGPAMNQFNRPTAVAVDAQGNVYVTDQDNNRIQKWAPGSTEGVTVASDIDTPTDIFVDRQGNIYASAQHDRLVKRWTPGNPTGTVVVNGSAVMYTATGIYVDEQGFVYICDTDNNRVYKWAQGAPSGVIVAGGNYGSAANQLINPLDIQVDCKGNVYVADYGNHRIQRWPPGAAFGETVFGTGSSGTASNMLNYPVAIGFDAALNMYIADFDNDRVQKTEVTIANTLTVTVPGVYNAIVQTDCCTVDAGIITIVEQKHPAISITASATSVCEGMRVSFNALIEDGGMQPLIQWMRNGMNTGSNTLLYAPDDLKDGDVISCILTSSEKCVDNAMASSNSIPVTVAKSGDIELGDLLGICPGGSLLLEAPSGYISYKWQNASSGMSLNATDPGLYWLKVKDACGNEFSDSATIFIYPVARNFLPADFSICDYDKINISSSVGFSSYLWNNGSNTPVILISSAGTYSLLATDQNGCTATDTVTVSLKSCPPKGIYVPKAFTPQGDGKNDLFKPVVAGQVKQYEFSVYNRYGQQVFLSRDPSKGWDGKLKGVEQDTNAYVWFCRYELDGMPVNTEKGTVLLIR